MSKLNEEKDLKRTYNETCKETYKETCTEKILAGAMPEHRRGDKRGKTGGQEGGFVLMDVLLLFLLLVSLLGMLKYSFLVYADACALERRILSQPVWQEVAEMTGALPWRRY